MRAHGFNLHLIQAVRNCSGVAKVAREPGKRVALGSPLYDVRDLLVSKGNRDGGSLRSHSQPLT